MTYFSNGQEQGSAHLADELHKGEHSYHFCTESLGPSMMPGTYTRWTLNTNWLNDEC